MKSIPLDAFLRANSKAAEGVFKRFGEIRPIFSGDPADGGPRIVLPVKGATKDNQADFMRDLAKRHGFIRCCFVSEGWLVESKSPTDKRGIASVALALKMMDQGESLEFHADRREVVWFSCEDYVTGLLMAQRFILRPEHGRPSLAPLRMSLDDKGESSGRLVHLLPPLQKAR